jgi:hypothetical protein
MVVRLFVVFALAALVLAPAALSAFPSRAVQDAGQSTLSASAARPAGTRA